jgi:hypothetical protein
MANTDPLWRPLPGGWWYVRPAGSSEKSSHQRPAMLVKTVERDGRQVITKLVVVADQVSSATFRELPISRIEALVNHPLNQRWRTSRGPDEDALSAAIDELMHEVPRRQPAQVKQPREPLRRPDGSDPEGFYRKVAEAYSEALLRTSRPAPILAAEAGVPVATVRRWVLESRRRGLLPPGRKGRAG